MSGPDPSVERTVPLTVLVADDDPLMRELLAFTLASAPGATRVIQAADGEEALAAVRRERPRVVILDVLMPKLDGYEVCRRIREDPDATGTKVVLVTAGRGQHPERAVGAARADGYLVKPFSPTALMEQVAKVLDW